MKLRKTPCGLVSVFTFCNCVGALSEPVAWRFRRAGVTGLLPLLLLLFTLPAGVQAQFTYTTTSGTVTITRYNGPGGAVTIPSTINGLPVTAVGNNAFYSCYQVRTVTIPRTVTSIGDQAFYQCTSLTNLTLPNRLTAVGDYAFSFCTGLTNVTIGSSVRNLGVSPFQGCASLGAITVDTNNPTYSSVGGVLFNKSRSQLLQYPQAKPGSDYTIPTGVTSIADQAFYNCSGLTNVTISDSVTSIGDHAFDGCTGLNGITMGKSVTTIGAAAFANCVRLAGVTIPGSVTNIAMSAFQACTGLSAITVDANNPGYSSLGGVLFNKPQATLLLFPASDPVRDYSIPSTVTSIADQAFYNCRSLTNVTIPNSVITIGSSAFSGCTLLDNVTIGSSVTSIGGSAFQACASLSALTVDPNNPAYSSVGGVLFNKSQTVLLHYPQGKTGSDYTVPTGVTSIGDQAFYNCSRLTKVTIPNSVTTIGNDAFWFCTGLASVTIGSSVTSIGAEAFYYCTALTTVTIPDSVTRIGDSAFASCQSLTNVTLGNGLTSISAHMFSGCKGLAGVLIPSSVTSLGFGAFEYCAGLRTITIPDSVTSLGYGAFWSCSSLTSATLGTNVTSAADDLFAYCYSLTNVTLSTSLTNVGTEMFWECSSLTTVTIPNRFTSIPRSMFYRCSSLTHLTIPNSVTSIGYGAFEGCTSLMGVFFQGDAPGLVSSFVFSGTASAVVYYLPDAAGWNPQVQANDASFGVRTNRFGFTILGTSGLGTVVQACTNLATPIWSPVATNILTGGPSYFSDSRWAEYPTRFYRLGGLTYGGIPAMLWNPQMRTGDASFGVRTNRFGFNIVGTPNIPIVVETSTSLSGAGWTALLTCTLTNGSIYFRDPNWTNYPARFYRMRSP